MKKANLLRIAECPLSPALVKCHSHRCGRTGKQGPFIEKSTSISLPGGKCYRATNLLIEKGAFASAFANLFAAALEMFRVGVKPRSVIADRGLSGDAISDRGYRGRSP